MMWVRFFVLCGQAYVTDDLFDLSGLCVKALDQLWCLWRQPDEGELFSFS